MAEYIEREAAIAALQKSHKSHAENSRDYVLLARDVRLLKEQPAADVVEVVRCKDCKNWSEHPGCIPFEDLRICQRQYGAAMRENDFCSLGERRENKDD